ncbi:MAG: potassium channel family protein [Cyanobacteria bacterium P01_G01_bin.54]
MEPELPNSASAEVVIPPPVLSPELSPELRRAITAAVTQAVAQALQTPTDILPEPVVLSYPRHPQLAIARQWLSRCVGLFFPYALGNCFWPLLPPEPKIYHFGLALLVIASGLSLVMLLVSELFLGAGVDQELQYHQGEHCIKDYQFIPSLNRFRTVLALLALGFVTIILGFANLYTELVRQDPANFGGLEAGFLAIYFSLVTFSTVGYGDIYPVSVAARLTAVCEIFIAMFFSLVAISSTLSWTIAHKRQQQELMIQQRIQAARQSESNE